MASSRNVFNYVIKSTWQTFENITQDLLENRKTENCRDKMNDLKLYKAMRFNHWDTQVELRGYRYTNPTEIWKK